MTAESELPHCATCLGVGGERVPVHDGAHVFEGHPEKDGCWWEHWELRLRGLEQYGPEFDAGALKMFGYRPRDRWGLEPRERPNYGRPGKSLKDIEGQKIPDMVAVNVRILEKKADKIPDIGEIPDKDSGHPVAVQENPDNLCPGCDKPLPVSATKPKRFHDDACRKRAQRKASREAK